MAIAKTGTDVYTSSGNLSYSFSHTLVSGSDRAIVLFIALENNDTISVSSITYGGVTMTLADSYLSGTSGARNLAAIYYLLNSSLPSDGAQTVQITLSGTASTLFSISGCGEYTGVAQTAPEATDTTYQTSSATIANTISPSAGAWVVSVAESSTTDNSWSHGQSQVELLDTQGTGGVQTMALAELRGANGETSLDSTFAGTVERLIRVAASFAAASGTVANQTPVVIYQINCGGSAVSPYIADQFFSGGTTSSTGTAITIPGSLVSPAPQGVYQTERYGNSTYTITGLTAYKRYVVRFHFAEIYWTAAGQRRFNVSIQGTQVLTNFDIYVAAGNANFTANIQTFYAEANSSGNIVIVFTTVTDNAAIQGIEIWTIPTNVWVNVAGVWKVVTDIYVNGSGTWRYINQTNVNVSGTWETTDLY